MNSSRIVEPTSMPNLKGFLNLCTNANSDYAYDLIYWSKEALVKATDPKPPIK